VPEILDQDEVEALLAAIDEGEIKAPGAPAEVTQYASYDFGRPERVSKDEARSLEALHMDIARNLSATFSGLLRSIVEVKLASVEEIIYSEFILSVPNPTYLNIINAKPLEGEMVLEINPSITFPILDKLLGGASEEVSVPNRPLKIKPVEFKVVDTEYNPQLLQIIPPTETVVLVGFEITLGGFSGMLNFCIPFVSLDPFLDQLSTRRWRAYTRTKAQPEALPAIQATVKNAYLDLAAYLAETTITLRDFLELQPGDIIQTEKPTSQPATVYVQGRAKFLASPGRLRRKKAVLIVGEAPGSRPSSS